MRPCLKQIMWKMLLTKFPKKITHTYTKKKKVKKIGIYLKFNIFKTEIDLPTRCISSQSFLTSLTTLPSCLLSGFLREKDRQLLPSYHKPHLNCQELLLVLLSKYPQGSSFSPLLSWCFYPWNLGHLHSFSFRFLPFSWTVLALPPYPTSVLSILVKWVHGHSMIISHFIQNVAWIVIY